MRLGVKRPFGERRDLTALNKNGKLLEATTRVGVAAAFEGFGDGGSVDSIDTQCGYRLLVKRAGPRVALQLCGHPGDDRSLLNSRVALRALEQFIRLIM